MKKLLIVTLATPLLVVAGETKNSLEKATPTPTQSSLATITPSTKIADLTVAQLQDIIETSVDTSFKKKVKVIDPMRTVQGDPYWLDKEADLKKETERRSKDIERVAMERERKANEMRAKANTVKRDVIEGMELELARLENEMKVKQQQAQRDLQEMYEMSQMEVYKHISEITKEISEKEGVYIVQAGGLIFADPSVDMSDKVIEVSKQKYAQEKSSKNSSVTLAKNEPTKTATKKS